MASLMERMAKSGHVKGKSIAQSSVFAEKPIVKTQLPIINIAFSGSLEGGLVPGLTVIAGPSKSYKSLISLYCLKAFQDKYPEGICLFYDCEYGISEDYMRTYGVDPDRVLYLEIENIEQLKFDMVQKLKSVEKNDKVFILIDSIGNMASVKEVDDAINEKSVADMSRAKSLKSLFRITTPLIVKNNVYCIAINHIYMEQGLYPKAIVSGGCVVENTMVKTDKGLVAIQNISVGDNVLTENGFHAVEHTWTPDTLDDGEPECFEVEFEDGSVMVVSENHRFMTKNGDWKYVSEITKEDDLLFVE